jgi:hypothetical protein
MSILVITRKDKHLLTDEELLKDSLWDVNTGEPANEAAEEFVRRDELRTPS